MMPMADGTALRTFYRLPDGDGPFPTIVVRSPYELPHTPLSGLDDIDYTGIAEEDYANVGWPEVTDNGYALVIQHTRGREGSEGLFSFINERADGVELVEWIRSQPWSDQKIGVTGDSIEAIEAMMLSAEASAGIDAAFAQIGTPDLINGSLIGPGGSLKLETFFLWGADLILTADDNHYEAMGYSPEQTDELRQQMLPIALSAFSEPVAAHTVDVWYPPMLDYAPFAEPFPTWNEILLATPSSDLSIQFDATSTDVPSYYVAAWHDVFASSQITAFANSEGVNPEQRLLILNGTHFTPEQPGAWPIKPMLPWFDYHLKGKTSALLDLPRVVFPISNEDDEWYGASTWPPMAAVPEVWHLSATGEVLQPGALAATATRTFNYDPADPVPTVGGKNLNLAAGTFDQQSVREDERADVLSYNSAPLASDLLVAGHLIATVSLSSDAPDTDITVKVLDVSPDGTATLVTEGIQRARFREGLDQALFMSPGTVYELEIDVGHMAWRFEAGNRIGIDISSSNFPQWDRNMNTGTALYISSDGVPAANTIHHGTTTRTSIELPVVSNMSQLTALTELSTTLSE